MSNAPAPAPAAASAPGRGLMILAGIVVLAIVIGVWFVKVGNGLVVKQENVKTAWAQVETVLQRRFDLIPNFVNTVKGYAEHEKDTLVCVILCAERNCRRSSRPPCAFAGHNSHRLTHATTRISSCERRHSPAPSTHPAPLLVPYFLDEFAGFPLIQRILQISRFFCVTFAIGWQI